MKTLGYFPISLFLITDFSGVNTLLYVYVLIFLNIINGFSDMTNEKVLQIQYLLFLLL